MRYIEFLLTNPGKETECLEIERACNQKERDARTADETVAIDDSMHTHERDLNQMDEKEILKNVDIARGVITDSERKLDETTDPSEQAHLRGEIEKARKYIAENVNMVGKVRPSGPVEAARKRVSAAISTAKKNIAKEDASIGQHFTFIKARGTAFVYEPDRECNWISS